MNQKNIFEEVKNGLNGFFHITFGIIFIIIGTIGLFLPMIPGILLILAGLYLVGGRKLIHKVRAFFTGRK